MDPRCFDALTRLNEKRIARGCWAPPGKSWREEGIVREPGWRPSERAEGRTTPVGCDTSIGPRQPAACQPGHRKPVKSGTHAEVAAMIAPVSGVSSPHEHGGR